MLTTTSGMHGSRLHSPVIFLCLTQCPLNRYFETLVQSAGSFDSEL